MSRGEFEGNGSAAPSSADRHVGADRHVQRAPRRRTYSGVVPLRLQTVEPFPDQRCDEGSLLGPEPVARPIEDRERPAREGIEQRERVGPADDVVLAARDDEGRAGEGLGQRAGHVDREVGPSLEAVEERAVGDAGTCN